VTVRRKERRRGVGAVDACLARSSLFLGYFKLPDRVMMASPPIPITKVARIFEINMVCGGWLGWDCLGLSVCVGTAVRLSEKIFLIVRRYGG